LSAESKYYCNVLEYRVCVYSSQNQRKPLWTAPWSNPHCTKTSSNRQLARRNMCVKRVWRYQRIRISKKDRQHNDQKKKDIRTNNDLQNITHNTKDGVTRIPLKPGGELRCTRKVGSSCSSSGTRRVNLVTNPVISCEWGKNQEVFTTSGTFPWSFVT